MLTALPNPTDWLFCTAPSYGKPQCSLWSQGSVTCAFIAAERGLRDICVQAFILQDPFVQVWVQYLCTGKSIRASSCTSAWYWVHVNPTPLQTNAPSPHIHLISIAFIPLHFFQVWFSPLPDLWCGLYSGEVAPSLPWAIHWKRPAAATH